MAGFTGTKTQEDIKKNEENKNKKIEEKKNAASNKDKYYESTYEEAKAKYGQGVGNNKYFMSKEDWEKGKAEQSKQETPKKEQSLVANRFGDKTYSWDDVKSENGNDPEKISNWLNNNPGYKAGDRTKKGMSEYGYKQDENGKWGKDDTVTNDKVIDKLDEITVGNGAVKAFVEEVTNPETGDVDEEKAKGEMAEYEKKLVEMGGGSYDKDGNFVLNNINTKGWEDWATVLSAGISVLGLAFGVPIIPINFRNITNKDEREAKIRELQQQYMDIKAVNAGKVEDVISSAEAGKIAKENKEDIDAFSKYVDNVASYKAKSDIDTESQKDLIDKNLEAEMTLAQAAFEQEVKKMEISHQQQKDLQRLLSGLSTDSAIKLLNQKNYKWVLDAAKDAAKAGLDKRAIALNLQAWAGNTATTQNLKHAESIVDMVTDVVDSAAGFVPGNGGKGKD